MKNFPGNVYILKGDGFYYAVRTNEESKTLYRGRDYDALRRKLIKKGYAILSFRVG